MPAMTRPKTVYFASRCGCGECVMKNWLPPVSGQIERHADGAAQVRPLVQLVANRVAGPAFAVAARIAVLHDEVGHDAVDAEAVEVALARQRDEVLDRQRRVEHRQLDLNRAAIGVDVHLRRHRRVRRGAAPYTRPAAASSAPAGSARRRRRPPRDRAASAASPRGRAPPSPCRRARSSAPASPPRRRTSRAPPAPPRARCTSASRWPEPIRLGERRARRSAASARRGRRPPPRGRPDRRPSAARAGCAAALGAFSFTSDVEHGRNHPLIAVVEHRRRAAAARSPAAACRAPSPARRARSSADRDRARTAR